MNELLNQLESSLKTLNAPVINLFAPPLEKESELNNFIEDNFSSDVIIPIELFELYKWHAGTDYTKATNNILQQGYFCYEFALSGLEEVLANLADEEVFAFRKNLLFPFGTSQNGEFLAVELFGENRIVYCQTFDHEVDSLTIMFDDFFAFLKTEIKQFDNKCFKLDEDKVIVLDPQKYDDYMSIGEKMNSKATYWRMKREFNQE